jgi:hypothetical protein
MDMRRFIWNKPYQMALEMDLKFPAIPTGSQFEKLQIHNTFVVL